MITVGQQLYRYEGSRWQGWQPKLTMCVVTKVTRCGCWVARGYDGPRFILFSATKQYAHETKSAAWRSYMRRCERQVLILRAQMDSSIERLAAAKEADQLEATTR